MNLLVLNSHGFQQVADKVKTATSRLGDRTTEFKVGDIVKLVEPDSANQKIICIQNVYVKKLKDITETEAVDLGDNTPINAIITFTSIYARLLQTEITENTIITLIYFKVIEE